MTEEQQADSLAAIVAALADKRFRYNSEVALHDGIAQAFEDAGIAYRREVRIDGGRIDFLVGAVGIEVKIGGSSEALRRQVSAYTESPHIESILVLTTRPAHREVGGVINDKPVRVRALTYVGGLSL